MKRLELCACGVGVALSVIVAGAQGSVSGVFFTEGWESGSLSQSFNSQSYGNSSGSQYRAQGTFVGGGSWAFQHQLDAGLASPAIQYATQHIGDSIAGPVLAAGRGEHFNDLYVQYKVAYSTGFQFNSSNFKQMIIGTQDDRRHDDPCCNPWVAHYLTIYPPQPTRPTLLAEANNKQGASGQWVGFTQNASGYSSSNLFFIQTGRFYRVEVRRRLNDPGVDNGIFQLWIDGVLLSDYRDVRYRVPYTGSYGATASYGTNFVMISDYSSQPPARDQQIYYDDIRFSTTYIGTGTGTVVAPAAPTNLQITR